jgi:two-component system, sensor histidine kinase and response regulator
MSMNKNSFPTIYRQHSILIDLILTAITCAVSWVIFIRVDLFEWLYFTSRKVEWLDELAEVSLVLSICLAVFSWRRWREAKAEVGRRQKIELELVTARDSAEAGNIAKSTFLATMSHEIRTPMNGILGMTELVLDSELTSEQRENLALVRLSAESLLSIINDILDFSKIEAGKLEIESIPFDLRESLGETMKGLSVRADQKGLELIYEIEPNVPEAVLGDPGRIRQILINLIGNAIKFTAQGEIFIHVEEQSQGPLTTTLHFAIKDTGVGIPADKLETIFELFSQADGSMARKYGGTGLGLAICVNLAERMNGRVWVESQPDLGSTFHFTVGLGVQDAPSARPQPLQPDQLRNLPVLIVDDNLRIAGSYREC